MTEIDQYLLKLRVILSKKRFQKAQKRAWNCDQDFLNFLSYLNELNTFWQEYPLEKMKSSGVMLPQGWHFNPPKGMKSAKHV